MATPQKPPAGNVRVPHVLSPPAQNLTLPLTPGMQSPFIAGQTATSTPLPSPSLPSPQHSSQKPLNSPQHSASKAPPSNGTSGASSSSSSSRESKASTARKVGKYILGKTLGQGTFGKVKYATDTESGRGVAIKILDKAKIRANNMGEQIKKEARITADSSLAHSLTPKGNCSSCFFPCADSDLDHEDHQA
jgi:hypothetical protein